MSNITNNWRARTLGAAAAMACALTFLLSSGSTPAKADSWSFIWQLSPQQQYALGIENYYRSTQVWGSDWVAAGAHWPGGWTLYASYAVGFGYACHGYNGYQALGGMMQNASLYLSQSMTITERYGGAEVAAC